MKIRLRRIGFPILFCLTVACLIELPMSYTDLFGNDSILWDTLFRAILALPMLMHLYREDQVFRGKEKWNLKIALLSFCLGAVLSFLFGMAEDLLWGAELLEASAEYTESLFTGNMLLQTIVLLVASPLLEEYFFRGVLYGRVKELFPAPVAMILISLLFGIYHWDLLQGIYSFFMGLLLACFMEKTNTVKAPVLFHAGANLAALALAMI